MFDGIELCNLITSSLGINVPVGLLALARNTTLVLLLTFDKILSTLAIKPLSFAIIPFAPATAIA